MTVRNATFDELDAVKRATIVSVNNATRRAEAVDIRALSRLEAFDFDKANEAAVTVAKLKLDVEKLAANVAKLRR